MQHEINALAVVQHILVITHLQAIAIDRQRQIVERIGGEERYRLFGVMVGANVVRAARHRCRQPIGDVVGINEMFRPRFARRIGAARLQRIALA